jgi:hypothetical protein
MKIKSIVGATGLCLALCAAAGCSGVDKNENNNTPAGNGTLTGQISTSVTCDASATESDCDGTVYLVLMENDPITSPMQTPEAIEIMGAVDLSGGSVTYTMNNVPAGTWYISGFMDDDANASSALPSPDVGDPVGYPAPQVTIVADQTTTQNLTFTMRVP